MGANTDVVFTITASNAQALPALEAVAKKLQKAADAAGAMGGKAKKGGQDASASFSRVIRDASRAATTFLGIGSTLQAISTATAAVRREWEVLKQYQAGSADQQVRVARAARGLKFSLPTSNAIKDMSADDIVELAHTGVGGVDPEQALWVFRAAVSAGLGEKISERIGVAQKALLLRRDLDEQGMRQLASSGMSLAQQYGGTAAQQIAMVTLAEPLSRVEEPEKFSKYIVSAVAQLQGLGFKEAEAFAVANALGTRGVEAEGQITGTQTINLMAQVIEEVSRRHPGLRGMDAVRAFREDAEMRKRILGAFDVDVIKNMQEASKHMGKFAEQIDPNKVSGRARMLIPSIEFLTKAGEDTLAKKYYQASITELPSLEEAEKKLTQKIREVEGSLGDLAFQFKMATDEFGYSRKRQPGVAITGQMAEFIGSLPSLGIGSANIANIRGAVARLRSMESERIPGGLRDLQSEVARASTSLRMERPITAGGFFEGAGAAMYGQAGMPVPIRTPTANERAAADDLSRFVEKLDRLIENSERALELQRQQAAQPQSVRVVGDERPRYEQPEPLSTP